jgi:hypothetical protein
MASLRRAAPAHSRPALPRGRAAAPIARWRSARLGVLQNDREVAADALQEPMLRRWPSSSSAWPEEGGNGSDARRKEEARGTVLHFSYGANMAYTTLARRDVRPLRCRVPTSRKAHFSGSVPRAPACCCSAQPPRARCQMRDQPKLPRRAQP